VACVCGGARASGAGARSRMTDKGDVDILALEQLAAAVSISSILIYLHYLQEANLQQQMAELAAMADAGCPLSKVPVSHACLGPWAQSESSHD